MQTIFLSHSSADTEFARRLVDDLKNHDWDARTFEDVVTPDIPLSSTEIDSRIVRAIQTDSFYVPILTPAALTSNWFKKEIEIAISSEENGSIASIVPALGEECIIPDILGLRTPCDFTTSYDAGFESLLEKLSVPTIRPDKPSLTETRHLAKIQTLSSELQLRYRALYSPSLGRLEELIGEVFESIGYRVEISGRTCDGGIDLFVVGTKDGDSYPFLVECKRYTQGQRIGIEPVISLREVGDGGPDRRSLISTTLLHKYHRESFSHLTRSRWDLSYAHYSAVLKWLASCPELSSEVTQPIDQARDRYAELIDKRFSSNLSLDEQNELVLLEELFDEVEAPLYSPAIKRLKEIRDKLSSDPSIR
jgi:TIR domain/Restriction endonuclease